MLKLSDKNYYIFIGMLLVFDMLAFIYIGWRSATLQIEHECNVIGQFYDGTDVYDCERYKQKYFPK